MSVPRAGLWLLHHCYVRRSGSPLQKEDFRERRAERKEGFLFKDEPADHTLRYVILKPEEEVSTRSEKAEAAGATKDFLVC